MTWMKSQSPQGWGIYLDASVFISRLVLGVYGLMLVGMGLLQVLFPAGRSVPTILMPQSVVVMFPLAIVAIYFYFVAEPEPEAAKRRRIVGRVATFAGVLVVMQVLAVLLWMGISKAFKLH